MKQYEYNSIKLLIDMDDTISDLLVSWVSFLNTKYGYNVDYKMILDWEIEKYFPDLTTDEIYEILSQEDLWKTVLPKKDAVGCLKRLIDDGFDLYICTSSYYTNIKSKFEQVIQKHFPFIPWCSFIVTNNKQMIKGDILVDDGVHNLIGGDYKKILMTAPHNINFDAKRNDIIRADNWKKAYREIIRCSEKILREREKVTFNGDKGNNRK